MSPSGRSCEKAGALRRVENLSKFLSNWHDTQSGAIEAALRRVKPLSPGGVIGGGGVAEKSKERYGHAALGHELHFHSSTRRSRVTKPRASPTGSVDRLVRVK